MDLPVASHKTIVDWWSKNSFKTNLYIGNGAYKVRNNSDVAWNDKKELPKQLELARTTPEISGNIMFSAKSLMTDNEDVVDYIHRKYYKMPALNPASPFFRNTKLKIPRLLHLNETDTEIMLQFDDLKGIRYGLLYKSGHNLKEVYPIKKLVSKIFIEGGSNRLDISKNLLPRNSYALSFIDVYGVETKPMILNLKN
jgi:hypothetical protein